MNYQKKIKAILAKGLKKDRLNKFSIPKGSFQNTFLHEYLKIV